MVRSDKICRGAAVHLRTSAREYTAVRCVPAVRCVDIQKLCAARRVDPVFPRRVFQSSKYEQLQRTRCDGQFFVVLRGDFDLDPIARYSIRSEIQLLTTKASIQCASL